MNDKSKLIEFTESERNIIRYCVEFELKRRKKAGDSVCVEILTPIYEKLVKLYQQELRTGISENLLFV